MFWLRRAAFRTLSSSPSVCIPPTARTYSYLPSQIPRCTLQKSTFTPLQRRFASDEVATQSESEVDGATEAEHGDNSIAASSDAISSADANPTEPPKTEEQAIEQTIAPTDSTTQTTADQASSTPQSVSDAAKSGAQQATNAFESAAESVKSTATAASESLSSAAGFGGNKGKSSIGEPAKTVYVGNLFFDVRSEDLKREFERAGPVVDAKIIMDQRGLSKGFGYVEFVDVDAATKAIELYNLQNFEGRRLSVQYSIGKASQPRSSNSPDRAAYEDRPMHPPTKTLFIGNMSFDMSDRDLNNLFREIKNVIDVRVAIDRRTGQPRGFAHADFTDVASAEKAMDSLKGKMVCGRALRVDFSISTGRAAVNAQAI